MHFTNKTIVVYVLFFIACFCVKQVKQLTGHVCRRQKEETYRVTTNRAFLCSERYTTSCGYLDWRRCTKDRVQTCYTPSECYVIRYREIEECCPGWQRVAGACTIPACHGLCQNGGVCTEIAAIPHCSCLPGFHGDMCQHKNDEVSSNPMVPAWLVPVVVIAAIGGAVCIALITLCVLRKNRPRYLPVPTQNPDTSRTSRVHSSPQTPPVLDRVGSGTTATTATTTATAEASPTSTRLVPGTTTTTMQADTETRPGEED